MVRNLGVPSLVEYRHDDEMDRGTIVHVIERWVFVDSGSSLCTIHGTVFAMNVTIAGRDDGSQTKLELLSLVHIKVRLVSGQSVKLVTQTKLTCTWLCNCSGKSQVNPILATYLSRSATSMADHIKPHQMAGIYNAVPSQSVCHVLGGSHTIAMTMKVSKGKRSSKNSTNTRSKSRSCDLGCAPIPRPGIFAPSNGPFESVQEVHLLLRPINGSPRQIQCVISSLSPWPTSIYVTVDIVPR
ncbi:hypothetical protein SCLCIDRAFT_964417 [Scleroderma citrinum Foug A]|uniref:Uncharacterized protein n=1 Tax=Scleroderma citrinum Foug A TaxID=1036808 RepID=A0A0C2ZEU3_9AGAM|nr:hypothetical protein SCLCIDRAFT_964417 [Scleroderma citrinum Foug A]